MPDVLRILEAFHDGSLNIHIDGPPRYAGKYSRRIIVEGDVKGIRMFGQLLLAMAETVETDPVIQPHGWHLVLNPEDVMPLKMDDEYQLVLNCEIGDTAAGTT